MNKWTKSVSRKPTRAFWPIIKLTCYPHHHLHYTIGVTFSFVFCFYYSSSGTLTIFMTYCVLGNISYQAPRSSYRNWRRKTWKPKSCHNFYSWRSTADHWHESGNSKISKRPLVLPFENMFQYLTTYL